MFKYLLKILLEYMFPVLLISYIVADVLTAGDFAIFNKACDNFTSIIKFTTKQRVFLAAARIPEHTALGYLFLNKRILPK